MTGTLEHAFEVCQITPRGFTNPKVSSRMRIGSTGGSALGRKTPAPEDKGKIRSWQKPAAYFFCRLSNRSVVFRKNNDDRHSLTKTGIERWFPFGLSFDSSAKERFEFKVLTENRLDVVFSIIPPSLRLNARNMLTMHAYFYVFFTRYSFSPYFHNKEISRSNEIASWQISSRMKKLHNTYEWLRHESTGICAVDRNHYVGLYHGVSIPRERLPRYEMNCTLTSTSLRSFCLLCTFVHAVFRYDAI